MFLAASKTPRLGIAAKADGSGLSVYDSEGVLLATIGGRCNGTGESHPGRKSDEPSRLEEGEIFLRRNDP